MNFLMCKKFKGKLNSLYVDICKIVIVLVAVIQKEQLEELHLRELNNISIVNLANLKSIKPTFLPRTISHVCQIVH